MNVPDADLGQAIEFCVSCRKIPGGIGNLTSQEVDLGPCSLALGGIALPEGFGDSFVVSVDFLECLSRNTVDQSVH